MLSYKDTSNIVKPEHHIILLYCILLIIVIIGLFMLIKYRCSIPKLYLPEIMPKIEMENVQYFEK